MPSSLDQLQIRELEIAIADRIYIQIGKWNLYLGDAGVAKDLAIECQAHLDNGSDVAARKALESIQVSIGGGNTRIPLARLIPASQIFDLEEILEPYCR